MPRKIFPALYMTLAGLMLLPSCKKDEPSTPGGGGAPVTHLNPSLTYGSLVDQSGNSYATIVIGGQEWMAENLRASNYANGDPITAVPDGPAWAAQTGGAWAHYGNDSAFDDPFGKLYNGYAVTDPRNVCPAGWHVPTVADWSELIDTLGGAAVAGDRLKSAGTAYWPAPNAGATNAAGFSALPGGFRIDSDGSFFAVDTLGNWWSATDDGGGGLMDYVINEGAGISSFGDSKAFGCSVRCVRD